MRAENAQILAAALVLAGDPLAYLGHTLAYMDARAPSPVRDPAAGALRKTAMRPDCESLVEKLTRADVNHGQRSALRSRSPGRHISR